MPGAVAIGATAAAAAAVESPFVYWSSCDVGTLIIGWRDASDSGRRRVRYSWEAFLYVLELSFVGLVEDGEVSFVCVDIASVVAFQKQHGMARYSKLSSSGT